MSEEIRKYHVVIIGGGFSGIVAASYLAGNQLEVLLVDENLHIGGQLLRKIPEDLGTNTAYHPDYIKKIGFRFVESVKKKEITIMNRTCLVGIYEDNQLLLERDREEIIPVAYEVLLFATGARERFFPFKGWTLPGVYSTGLTQVLMKSSGVMPAKEIIIAGSGLFLFSVAYEFLKNKGKVNGIFEQSGMMDKIKFLPLLFRQFSKFAEGGKFLSRIYLSGVPVRYRRKIVEVRGRDCLEEVVVGKSDKNGQLIAGSERIMKASALAVGYGFVPNVEGPQLAGCDLNYYEAGGGWIVVTDEKMETSRPNIFAAGEITGIGGALKSINEGKLAAYGILHRFCKINDEEYRVNLRKLSAERRHHMKFVEYFNLLYKVPGGAVEEISDDVVVCRCEHVTMGEIRKAVSNGYRDLAGLKNAVRASMGNCQGRTCGPMVADIVASLSKAPIDSIGEYSARPPLKPVSFGSLINYRKD